MTLPPQAPVPPQPPLKRSGHPVMVGVVCGVLGLILGLIVGSAGGSSAPTPTATMTVTRTKPPPTPQDQPSQTAAFHAKPSDFTIGVLVRRQQCFGSAGCNIVYRIDPTYIGAAPLPTSGTVEVGYAVSGDESGPLRNTFTIKGGKASYPAEETASTRSASVKLTAKAVSVDYQP